MSVGVARDHAPDPGPGGGHRHPGQQRPGLEDRPVVPRAEGGEMVHAPAVIEAGIVGNLPYRAELVDGGVLAELESVAHVPFLSQRSLDPQGRAQRLRGTKRARQLYAGLMAPAGWRCWTTRTPPGHTPRHLPRHPARPVPGRRHRPLASRALMIRALEAAHRPWVSDTWATDTSARCWACGGCGQAAKRRWSRCSCAPSCLRRAPGTTSGRC